MSRRILNVRVRPARVVGLITRRAEEKDLLLAFEFFSKIWGGRFSQLLTVDPKLSDGLTLFRLGASRPEFVYGIGIDNDHWSSAVNRACQPRGYGSLQQEFVRGLKQARFEDYYLVDHALIHLFQTRDQRKSRKRSLRLVTPEESSKFAVYCAAVFGVHHQNLRNEYFDENNPFKGETTSAFLDLSTEFVRGWCQSWLDVTGHELSPHISGAGPLAPTIVLVGSPVEDLALFWNLRTASDTTHPVWVIPIPHDGATESTVLDKLKDWLIAFSPYGRRSDYCLVTSQTVDETECKRFAEQFQTVLLGTPIEQVHFEPPRNHLPVVIPVEYETTWEADISGRKLTIRPPKPKAFENLGSPKAWFVDLLKDVQTGRAVGDLKFPASPVVFELLNGPCPPGFELTAVPRTGEGTDSINLRCSGNKEVINLHLPSGEEVLEELLREHGVEPLPDEKRSSYLPVIRRFGGLQLAAEAFSGTSGLTLAALEDRPKTLDEIKGTCKITDGILPGMSYADRIGRLLGFGSERTKRIGAQRFAHYARNQSPESLKLASVLEFWTDRSVLTGQWKIGPCRKCHRTSFVPHLNIQRRILCPSCGNRMSLLKPVSFGYSLHAAVGLAMREGIASVVLTGRFLRDMTHTGFCWLPGVKYKIGDQLGDIDLLACCDGHLVFCECKRLQETPPGTKVWDEVVSQFLETASVAKRCGGSLVVLGAQVNEYPQDVLEGIKDGIGDSIPHLLLNRLDLETGRRDVSPLRALGFCDLLPDQFPELPLGVTDKPRTINMGWGIYSR
jgi:hypothetical protein